MQVKFKKIGKIITPNNQSQWWNSHAMAPTAILYDGCIRIFLGCWDKNNISRIGFIDVDCDNPLDIIRISELPVLEIGRDGTFDENGVFPGHATMINNKVYLYYTGFQLGYKIRHYNFGGLAISDSGKEFVRVSEAPILDRSDEGLFVRAGQSSLFENGMFRTVYSAGGGWEKIGGKARPVYDVFYQESSDGIKYNSSGRLIVKHDKTIEHGLGRPQILKYKSLYFLFYTRRTLDMKYSFGISVSSDCIKWEKIKFENNLFSKNDFDSDMVYFPSVIECNKKLLLFYSGNDFGGGGLGCAEINLGF